MKVGTHAKEPLDEIIARKSKEIEDEGYALWGYGGNTCHPRTMVQPFAESFVSRGGTIYLCMQPMDSKHFAEQMRAEYSSANGEQWDLIPAGINVLGSRYALVIKGLRPEELELSLSHTRVAIGNSRGRPGNKYIQGRVDKACLEITDASEPAGEDGESKIKIDLVAELQEPYAVFVK